MLRKFELFRAPAAFAFEQQLGNSAPQAANSVLGTFNPGPDAIAGDMAGLYMAGITGSQRGWRWE